MSRSEDVERFAEIIGEIKGLMQEAKEIVSGYSPLTRERFKSYPYAHIIGALDNDHEFMGGSMITMWDILEEIREGGENE